jgi:hypothetical protein
MVVAVCGILDLKIETKLKNILEQTTPNYKFKVYLILDHDGCLYQLRNTNFYRPVNFTTGLCFLIMSRCPDDVCFLDVLLGTTFSNAIIIGNL